MKRTEIVWHRRPRLCAARSAALAFVLILAALPAFGQCAMCYESASGAAKKGQQAITRAIGVLLLPTLGMMAGLVTLAVRYKGVEERKHDHDRVSS